jgi:hypothetical protein
MLGGALIGNSEIVQRSMHELLSLGGGLIDAARLAGRTWKTGEQLIPKGSMVGDVLPEGGILQAGAFGTDPGTVAGNTLKYIGKIVNLPSRAIKTVDEFSKQLEFRAVIRADAMTEGMSKGMSASEAVRFADDRLEKLVVDGQLEAEAAARRKATAEGKAAGKKGPALKSFVERRYPDLFDSSLSKSIDRGFKAANEVTLQTPLEFGSPAQKVQAALNAVHPARFIVPFYRTPVNIAKFAGQRMDWPAHIRMKLSKRFSSLTPGLEASRSRYVRDMLSGDENLAAEATGRLAMGTSLMGAGLILASGNYITGRGPADKAQRRAMTDAGWKPYSLRTPNGYVSYLRMDPFVAFFGLMADMADTQRLADASDDAENHSLAQAALIAFANNFTQRTFLQGLGHAFDAMSDPSKNMESLVEQFASAAVPNTFAQAIGALGDDSLKETHGIMERLLSRVPVLSEGATPQRNMLGEVIKRDEAVLEGLIKDPVGAYYGLFQPIAYREVSSDRIRLELFDLKHGFQPPRAKIAGIDLREVEDSRGQSAHDRWAELHGQVKVQGKTLRQNLSRLIGSRAYQKLSKLPDSSGPSPRIRLIRSTLSRYRDKAFDQMLREFPQLARDLKAQEQNKRDRRRGLNALR